MNNLSGIGISLAILLVAGCSGPDTTNDGKVNEATQTEVETKSIEQVEKHSPIMMALQNPDRSDADKADDTLRKAAEVLKFTDLGPGNTVLELEAGGGYYTELFSLVTGPKGKIIYQNPASFDSYMKPEDVVARFGEDGKRLPNVERHKSNFDDLSFAADNSVDVVTWFLGPHELWFANPEGQLDLGDPTVVYAEIFRVLKPGGKFVALDHKTAPGTPETSGGETHRIDPAKIRERAEASGLQFLAESDVLANSSDNYDVMVFDPSVRRKTDRFLHKYVKPK